MTRYLAQLAGLACLAGTVFVRVVHVMARFVLFMVGFP